MSPQDFFSKLTIVTLASAGLIFCLNFQPCIYSAQVLSWSSLLAFVILSLLIYIVGSIVAKQQNLNNYTGVILFVMFIKMCLCIVLVGAYAKTNQSTQNYFLIPFFSIYIIYTIFEVHLMTRLGKNG